MTNRSPLETAIYRTFAEGCQIRERIIAKAIADGWALEDLIWIQDKTNNVEELRVKETGQVLTRLTEKVVIGDGSEVEW